MITVADDDNVSRLLEVLFEAALDVQYDEPVRPDDPLLGLDNVLLTPHVAGGARTNLTGDIEELVLNLHEV